MVLSIVIAYPSLALLLTPPMIVLAVKLCSPSFSGVLGVKFQLPSLSALVVPKECVPSKISTVANFSALPFNSGVLSSVLPFFDTSPVVLPKSSYMVVIVGSCTLLMFSRNT